MRRREFLLKRGRASVGLCLLVVGQASEEKKSFSHNPKRAGVRRGITAHQFVPTRIGPFDFPNCTRPAICLSAGVVSFRERVAMASLVGSLLNEPGGPDG